MSIIRRIWDRKVWRFSFITPAVTTIETYHQTPTWLKLIRRVVYLFLAICLSIFSDSQPTHHIQSQNAVF